MTCVPGSVNCSHRVNQSRRMCKYLKYISDGHCSMREPMHKDSLQQTLSIVECPAPSCNAGLKEKVDKIN